MVGGTFEGCIGCKPLAAEASRAASREEKLEQSKQDLEERQAPKRTPAHTSPRGSL